MYLIDMILFINIFFPNMLSQYLHYIIKKINISATIIVFVDMLNIN